MTAVKEINNSGELICPHCGRRIEDSSTPPSRFVKQQLRRLIRDNKTPYRFRLEALRYLSAIDGILLTSHVGNPKKNSREELQTRLTPQPSPKKMTELEKLMKEHPSPEIPGDSQ